MKHPFFLLNVPHAGADPVAAALGLGRPEPHQVLWTLEHWRRYLPHEVRGRVLLTVIRDPWARLHAWHRSLLGRARPNLCDAIGLETEAGSCPDLFAWQIAAGNTPPAQIDYHSGLALVPPGEAATREDRLIRLRREHLADDWRALGERFAIELPPLPAQAEAGDHTAAYTPELADLVGAHYAADVAAGGYKYPVLVGDLIARASHALGLERCAPCEARRRVLNALQRRFSKKD